GPWLVTADELPDAAKGLKIQSRLNGAVMQSDNTDNMMFPIVEMLVYITQGITLEPGDVIFTGTPSGVGHARKPPVWMKNGDMIEGQSERVGILRTPIPDKKPSRGFPLLRSFIALLALCAAPAPARAQEQARIGMGYGFAFLPLYICEGLKLIDKQAKAAHVDVQAKFPRFAGSGELHAAVASGLVDMAPFGAAPLLAAWQKGKGRTGQILALSGISSLPLSLLSN